MPELVCCKLTYIEGRSFTWARLRRINLETIRHFVKFDMIVGIHRFNFDRYIAWVAVHTCLVLFGDFNFSHVKSSRVCNFDSGIGKSRLLKWNLQKTSQTILAI